MNSQQPKPVSRRELLQRRYDNLNPLDVHPVVSLRELGTFDDKEDLKRALCRSIISQLAAQHSTQVAVAVADIRINPQQVAAYKLVFSVPHSVLVRLLCTSHSESKHFYNIVFYDNIQPERFKDSLPIPAGKMFWPIGCQAFDRSEVPVPVLYTKIADFLSWPAPNRDI